MAHRIRIIEDGEAREVDVKLHWWESQPGRISYKAKPGESLAETKDAALQAAALSGASEISILPPSAVWTERAASPRKELLAIPGPSLIPN
jgi:hypothetical protein